MAKEDVPSTSNRSLCEQLRTSSRKVHNLSNALVSSKLLILFCDRTLYGCAIGRFYFVFKTLEEELQRHTDDAEFSEVAAVLPSLYRTHGLEEDLQFFLGNDKALTSAHAAGGGQWSTMLEATPAVREYCNRLREISRLDPLLLLAHSYTQHLAMAAGGQSIRRMARKYMELPPSKGTALFEFEGGTPNSLRDQFKAALDTLGVRLTEEQRQQMVVEHIAAFKLNNKIIAGASCIGMAMVAVGSTKQPRFEFPVGWLNTGRALATKLLPSLGAAIAVRPKILATIALLVAVPVLGMLLAMRQA